MAGAHCITDNMVIAAALALANMVSATELNHGNIYPPLDNIRKVSAIVAAAVANTAEKEEVSTVKTPSIGWYQFAMDSMYIPKYS